MLVTSYQVMFLVTSSTDLVPTYVVAGITKAVEFPSELSRETLSTLA